MKPEQILAAILLAIVISAVGTWQLQDWRLGKLLAEQGAQFQTDLAAIGNAAAAQARTEQDKRLVTEQKLATQDQQHTKELSDEQRKQAVIRGRLATTELRLSVLLDVTASASGCDLPTATGAVGVVHAARRAQLDPAHAQRIIGITDGGDQGLIALRACQAYAKEVSTPK